MRRLTIALIAAAFILLPLQDALSHGGGLNQDGCHNETATGGYHCHRAQGDGDVDWEAVAAVLGGLLVVGIVIRMINSDQSSATYLGFTPELAADQDGTAYAGARWKVSW